MKKQLIVMYEEDKKNPTNTWSGTSYQLREALKDFYDVVFIDSYDIKPLKFLKAFIKKIEKKSATIFLRPLYEKLHEIEINNRLSEYKGIPVLEIAENVCTYNNDFYLYRDMAYACYPYVLNKFKNDSRDYGHGMLKNISSRALDQRIKREKDLLYKSKESFYMNNWVVDKLKEIYPELSNNFVYVSSGFNKEFISNIKINKKNNQVLFVGIDYLRKGGDLVVEAFNKMIEKYNINAKLIVVSTGGGLKNKTNNNNIEFLGFKNRKELIELFSESSLYCMPARFEANGYVFIEAKCFGVPIVARNDYEMKYFVKNGIDGYLVDEYNSDDIADAMYKALTNTKMQKFAMEHIERNREKYSWRRVAKNIKNVIDQK